MSNPKPKKSGPEKLVHSKIKGDPKDPAGPPSRPASDVEASARSARPA